MVYIILGTGFEEIEAVAPCDILRRGGVQVQFAGIGGLEITGSNGITIKADCLVEEMDLEAMELIMLPGGMGGVYSILGSEAAQNAVRYAYENGKFVTAICAAPTILAQMGITDHKQAVVYPGMEDQMGNAVMQKADTAKDGKVLTGRAPGAALDFGYLLLAEIKNPETAEKVRAGMVYQH